MILKRDYEESTTYIQPGSAEFAQEVHGICHIPNDFKILESLDLLLFAGTTADYDLSIVIYVAKATEDYNNEIEAHHIYPTLTGLKLTRINVLAEFSTILGTLEAGDVLRVKVSNQTEPPADPDHCVTFYPCSGQYK